MTKSVKEKSRLSLIRKIRESNFDFFDPDSLRIKLCYANNYSKNKIDKYYKEFLTNTNFKDKLKEILFPIVKHLNFFDFYIKIKFTTYHRMDDYCFIMELQDKNRMTIGEICFNQVKCSAIFVEATDEEDLVAPKIAINSLVKIVNSFSSLDAYLKLRFFPVKIRNRYNKKNLRDNLKLAKIANLEKHFLFLNNFIKKIDEDYNFELFSNKTDLMFFITYYNIGANNSYMLMPIFDRKSPNSFRNKINYDHLNYQLINNEHCLIGAFLDYGILPEELKGDYQDMTIEQIFEYVNLIKY